MKSTLIIFITLAGFFLSYTSIHAQKSSFDPFLFEVEFYNDKDAKHGNTFTNEETGNRYKITNTPATKELSIYHEGKWLKHGVSFYMVGGRVQSKTSYYYGKKHGTRYYYFNDGSVMTETPYVNGKEEGMEIKYHFNRQPKFTTPWVKGKRHGEVLQYNDKGKLVSKTKYVLDKKVGETQWYK